MSKNNRKILIASAFCGLFLINMSTYAMKNNKAKELTKPIKTTYTKKNLATDMFNLTETLNEKLNQLTNFENEIKNVKNLNNTTEEEKSKLINQQITKISEFKKETDNLVYEFKKKAYKNNITLSELMECKKNSENIYENFTNLLEQFGEKCEQIINYTKKNFKIKNALMKMLEKDNDFALFTAFILGFHLQWIEIQYEKLDMYRDNILNKFCTKKELNETIEKIEKIKELYKQKKLDLEKKFNEQNINYYEIIKINQKFIPKNDYQKALQLDFKPHLCNENCDLCFENKMKEVLNIINEKLKFSSLADYNIYIEKYNEDLEEIYKKIQNNAYNDYEEIKNIYEEKIKEINKLASEIKDNNFSEIVNKICNSLKIACEKNKEKEPLSINYSDDEKKFNEFKNNILKMMKDDKDSEIVKLFKQSINIQKNISNLRTTSKNLQKNSNQKINVIQNYVEILNEYNEKLQNIYEKFLNNKYFTFSPYDNEELTNTKNKYKNIIKDLNEKIKKNNYNSKNTEVNSIIEKTTNLLKIISKDTTNVEEYIENYEKFENLRSEINKISEEFARNNHEYVDDIIKCRDLANIIPKTILNIKQFDLIKQIKIMSLIKIKENEKYSIYEKNRFDLNKDINGLKNEEIAPITNKIFEIYDIQKKFFETLDSINPEEKIDILNLSDEYLILNSKSLIEMFIINFFTPQKNAVSGEKLTKSLNLLERFLHNCYHEILNNSNYNKNELKKDLENIKMMLSQWCKLAAGFYNKKISTLLKNVENSTKKISKNYNKDIKDESITNYIKENSNIPKDFDLSQNKTYKNVLNLIEKIEKKVNIEKNPIIDEKLNEFYEKFENLNYYVDDINAFENLKKEFLKYVEIKVNSNNKCNDEEIKIIDKINNYIEEIENTIKENSNKKKEISINNFSTNDFNKLEKNAIIDKELNEFCEEFKNLNYDINNIDALENLKIEFENYYNRRCENKPFNKNELELVKQIREGGLAKIKDILNKYNEKKKLKNQK